MNEHKNNTVPSTERENKRQRKVLTEEKAGLRPAAS